MSSFFKALASLLADRQEFKLDAKKIKDDLVVRITPDAKRGMVKQFTLPADKLTEENLDSEIFGSLHAPVESDKAEYKAETLPSGKEKKEAPKPAAKPAVKKPAAKKPAKKAVKKQAPKKKVAKKPAAKKAIKVKEEKKLSPAPPVKDDAPTQETALPNASGNHTAHAEPDQKKIFEKCMADGKKLFDAKQYAEAEDCFLKAVQLDPDSPDAKQEADRAAKWKKAYEQLINE